MQKKLLTELIGYCYSEDFLKLKVEICSFSMSGDSGSCFSASEPSNSAPSDLASIWENHGSKDFYNWRRDIDKKIIDRRFRSRITYWRIETRYLRYLVSTRLDPSTSAGSLLATVISTGRISEDPFEATLRHDREKDLERELTRKRGGGAIISMIAILITRDAPGEGGTREDRDESYLRRDVINHNSKG